MHSDNAAIKAAIATFSSVNDVPIIWMAEDPSIAAARRAAAAAAAEREAARAAEEIVRIVSV